MNITTKTLTKKDFEDVRSQISNWSVPINTFYLSLQHWEDIQKSEALNAWTRVYSLILEHGWKIESKQKDPETYIIWLTEPSHIGHQFYRTEAYEVSPKGIKRSSIDPKCIETGKE